MRDGADIADRGTTDPTRERAIALFRFLKELTELRSKTIRTVDQYDEVLWLADLPREAEVTCAAWGSSDDAAVTETWIEIRRPDLPPAPQPDPELQAWLVSEQVQDSSGEMPELRDGIQFRIESGPGEDPPDAPFVPRRIEDFPEIKTKWEQYVEDEWWPWAERDRRMQRVQRVYASLYSIYQKQQRLGEQYEVVLGLGLLSWKPLHQHEIRRHLVTAQTSLRFDATRGVIAVGPAGEGAKPAIEEDMLDAQDRPDPAQQLAIEQQVRELDDELWADDKLQNLLRSWVHAASSEGLFVDSLQQPATGLPKLRVQLAPAIILRRRSERSFLAAFKQILAQLEDGAPVPPSVERFVTVMEDVDQRAFDGDGEILGGEDEEIYFPLQANDAQEQIVQRLASHQGVLVQGPPGTGKSHTIVNLVCHLLAAGQRVLVTSHASRALRVLRRYISERVPEIGPLAVILLGDDRESLQAMEDSVQGITHRYTNWNSRQSEREVDQLHQSLVAAKMEAADALHGLRAVRETETYAHPPRFGDYEGTLQRIAERVRAESTQFSWVVDQPGEDVAPPMADAEFCDLVHLLRDQELNDIAAQDWSPIDPETLYSPDAFADLVAAELRLTEAFDSVKAGTHYPEYGALLVAPQQATQDLAEQLAALVSEADRLGRHLYTWVPKAVPQILGDHDRVWRELLDATERAITSIEDGGRRADSVTVAGIGDRDNGMVKAHADALLRHLAVGGRWGWGLFRPAVVKQASYLWREVRVSGRLCDTWDTLDDLSYLFGLNIELGALRDRWALYHAVRPGSVSDQIAQLADLSEPLRDAIKLHEAKSSICELIATLPGVSEPTWHDLESLSMLLTAARAALLETELHTASIKLGAVAAGLGSIASGGSDPEVTQLRSAVESRDLDAYRQAFDAIAAHHQAHERLAQRGALMNQLAAAAPELARAIEATAGESTWDERASSFPAAWNWARAKGWLRLMADPQREEQLVIKFETARERVRNRLQAIASEKAWQHCFSRMTEHERQHLVAWAKAMRNLGRGTGKYAPIHRRAAREHMVECRSAIPAWIMPIYRVAETVRPGSDLYDVVIVDEASQSGPEALLLTYLAKKIVVVGDDKQIAPEFVGLDREDVNQLRRRHIAALPHSDQYGVDNSFFDLAEIRYQGRITLREHFRCMPEIIQFSNNLFYRAQPLIPLKQYGAHRLEPVVQVRHLADGYREGHSTRITNPPEAQVLVDAVLTSSQDEAYDGKTFGVISLQGHAQAQLIEKLLLEQLGPEKMERRQIVCGDAYAFQGDERDVIFLSLVAAPEAGRRIGTLTKKTDERRFNVAASRAREQMWLFHTATLNDLSEVCLRYQLLHYCTNPRVGPAVVQGLELDRVRLLAKEANRHQVQPPDPFDSWFEVDVFVRIAERGYRVIPQYEVVRYRIDLVVEGMERRMAVECDGDRWHGAERYMEDMTRQRMLERCGWTFWRLRGSTFALDPDGALEGLWKKLDQLGVYPAGHQKTSLLDSPPKRNVLAPTGDRCGTEASTRRPAGGLDDSEEAQARDDDVSDLDKHTHGHEDNEEQTMQQPAQLFPVPTPRRRRMEPYHQWQPRLVPDPLGARTSEMVEGLMSIVESEGPIIVNRVFQLYARAAGYRRVGKQIRSALNKALWAAIKKGVVQSRDETGSKGLRDRTLWKPNTPSIVVRQRGQRRFEEIPDSEIAAFLDQASKEAPADSEEEIFRRVLDSYEIKRMTQNIRERLGRIHRLRGGMQAG